MGELLVYQRVMGNGNSQFVESVDSTTWEKATPPFKDVVYFGTRVPPKFNSEWKPLKNGGKGRCDPPFLLGETVTFQGRFLLNFGRVSFSYISRVVLELSRASYAESQKKPRQIGCLELELPTKTIVDTQEAQQGRSDHDNGICKKNAFEI